MKSFGSLAAFAGFLAEAADKAKHADTRALDKAARIIEAEAKREIGSYQLQAGPFQAWAELADSTKEDRVRSGYTEDEPLLRSGKLRESINHRVEAPNAFVGSDLDEAVWMELGTAKIPPRSFLGAAAFRTGHQAALAAGGEVFSALVGHDVEDRRIPIIPEDI